MKTIRTTLLATLLAFTTAFTVPGGFAAGANTAAAATTDNWVNFRDTSWGTDYSTATNFTITTAEQLAQLAYLVEQGNNFSGKTITLDSDISLADHFWTPIGRLESLGFRGTFDGGGHTISGLYTAKKASIYTGLFGALGCGISGSMKNGIVKSLTISNSDIKGYEAESGTQCATGAIVGYLFYGTIEDCVVTSDVTVSSGSDCTGGIVGRMLYGYSRLYGCLCAATVTGTNKVGGLVGEAMSARVSSCLYTGSTVTSTTNATTVAATIGNNNEATINNTYYTNSSASNNSTDKLACEVDFNIGTDVTIDLYELHVFTHSGITENLISQDQNEYYSMSYDGKLYANHSMAFKPNVPVGYELSCNVTPTTSRVSPSETVAYVLYIDDPTTTTTVNLTKQLAPWTGEGDGTEASPYLVKTADDMRWIAAHVNDNSENKTTFDGKYFKLNNDITFTGGENNFTPIGRNNLYYFSGTFDGDGHTISGININANSPVNGGTSAVPASRQALFGTVKDATIKNLTLSNSTIAAPNNDVVGGIVAYSGSTLAANKQTTIENCHVNDDVFLQGVDHIGGIVANTGAGNTIVQGCSSAASLTGRNYVGGIAGSLGGSPSGSSTTITVTINHCLYYGTAINATGIRGALIGDITVSSSSTVTCLANYYCSLSKGLMGIGRISKSTQANSYVTTSNIDIFTDDTGKLPTNGAVRAHCVTDDVTVPGGISAGTTTPDVTTDNDELKALLGDNPIATYGDRMTIYDRGVKLGDDYYSHVITFNDQQDNTTLISQLEGLTFDVRLKGRRLYKDGSWNSLCLPFNLDVVNSPLKGAYTLMELDNKSHDVTPEGVTTRVYRQTGCCDDGKLYLFFTRVYDHIYAAKPYIIKWDKVTNYDENDSSFDILDPIFTNVTISDATTEANKFTSSSDGGKLEFIGLYKPLSIEKEDFTLLYFGSNNLLYNPAGRGTVTIGAFRAYFQLNGGVQVSGEASDGPAGGGGARSFTYDIVYGDDTALHDIVNGGFTVPGGSAAGATDADSWYDLGGRRLVRRPTTKGVYIHQGRRFVVM